MVQMNKLCACEGDVAKTLWWVDERSQLGFEKYADLNGDKSGKRVEVKVWKCNRNMSVKYICLTSIRRIGFKSFILEKHLYVTWI